MKAITLVLHPNPTLENKACNVRMNITPPTELPVAANPEAVARFSSNQWPMQA